jgi:pimeloyl-ACP methyl ester carboxylesterase
MIIPNFPGTLEERMQKLDRTLSKQSGIRLIGSSFGGLMAALFAMENESRVERMILLAPALNLMDFTDTQERETSVPTWIYHGKDDEVIPLETIKVVAKKIFRRLTLHVVDDDHYLHKTFKKIDWQELLN